jgi:tetratricopeptide (TPR) repeat protein/TolB-like protein
MFKPRLLCLGLLVVLSAVGASAGVSVAGQAAPPATQKARLAVIPFTGSAETLPEGYGAAPSQGIRYALQQLRAVRSVDSADIVAAADRLGLSLSEKLADGDLVRLARELQVRGLIAGTFAVDGETVGIQSRLVDMAGQGQVIQGEPLAGPADAFLAAAGRIMKSALQQFQVRPSEWDERRLETAFVAGTASLEAYVLYARGVWEQGLGTKDAHERAVRLFSKALEADQGFAQAHVALGVSLYATSTAGNMSNRWKASQEFRKAIQLNSKLAEPNKWLGDMLVISPRRLYDQAIQAYQAALEIWPDYAEARVGLGDARQAKGQYDEAIEEYKKALAIEPTNARVYLGMGRIYYNEKQLYLEAVAAYQQAIALDPKLIDAHLSLGEMYEEKGLYEEAVARYSHVLSLEPKHPGATYGLALAYEKVDVKKAIEQWERYIDLASTLPSEKEWVDIAKKHLGKLQRGEKPN